MRKIIVCICLCVISLELYFLPLMKYMAILTQGEAFTDVNEYLMVYPYNIALLIPVSILVIIAIRILNEKVFLPFIKRVEG